MKSLSMRLFTGLSLQSPVFDNLADVLVRLRPAAPLNWSPLENLHITLKFIGEFPDVRLPELRAALAALEPPGAMDIAVSGFGFFPNPHRPNALFAAVHATPQLEALARGADQTLAQIGVAPEKRPYTPHVTLARIKTNVGELQQTIAAMKNTNFGSFRAHEFHLYQSARAVLARRHEDRERTRPAASGGHDLRDIEKGTTGAAHSLYTQLASFPLERRS